MAFRATLEEVLEAEVILHVIDVSNPSYKEQRDDVIEVLHELGLEKIESAANYIEVFNKADLLSESERKHLWERLNDRQISVSALSGEGIDKLLNMLKVYFRKNVVETEVVVNADDGKRIAEIYRTAEVLERVDNDDKILFKIRRMG